MAKAVFVTYLIAVSIYLTSAYTKECAVGPAYWCQSFQNAEDCGALRHCTDTVWRNDENQAVVESSTACEWCQKILENTHKGIQHLANNEQLIKSSLTSGCRLFPLATLSSKCTNAVEKYGTSAASLVKAKRYETLCRLMNVCAPEVVKTTESPSTEKPMILGKSRCTWGPSYWCSSLSNSRECSAIDHCSTKIWSQQSIEKKLNDNICQYCEFTIGKLRDILEENKTVINVEKWLSGACSMLPSKELIDECVLMVSQYAEEILVLIKANIEPGVICQLAHMCKEATVTTRVTIEKQIEPNEIIPIDNDKPERLPVDEQSKMLCHVLVRATHDLHVNQHKTRNEIQIFLENDCQQLSDEELIQKCKTLVRGHGHDIFGHVASKVELSKICGYLDDFVDHSAVSNLPPVHCELCSFVLSTAKYMLDAKHAEDKVLLYIDEQVCARLSGGTKKACQEMVLNNGKELIDSIQSGTRSMLLCTRFQVCLDEILKETSPIGKDEMRSFLTTNFCDKLGSLKDACYALMNKDSTHLLHILGNTINGNELCRMFGLCPKKTPLLTDLNLRDDPSKCQRCVKDFARRKHIAERLVNHSSEFLHHLCGQLPNEDDCTKAIDDSLNELLTFIRSLDPKDICVQLKMCDEKSVGTSITVAPANLLHEEVIEYAKNDICPKLGSLSALCLQLVDSEGIALLDRTSKYIDPHRICEILDVCPSSNAMKLCQDKCECCTNKVEIYQLKLEQFLRTIVASTRVMCGHMPAHDVCVQLADVFESNVNKVISRFNSQAVCQLLTLCPATNSLAKTDQCQTCKTELNTRQNRFRTVVTQVTRALLASCTDDDCRSLVQSAQQKTLNQIEKMNSQTLCQQLGYCASEISYEPSPLQLRLRNLVRHQSLSLDQRLASHDLCSEYGQLKPMCEHLIASPQGHRYGIMYKALLENNVKLVADDLREQLSTKVNADVCTTCKNTVQSAKDFWLNSLNNVRNALVRTCERCPTKDECRDYYNQRYETIKSYLDTINSNEFCQSIRLCSSSSLTIVKTDQCSKCVDRLENRKESVLRGVARLARYFDDVCQRFALKPCQIFVQQIEQSIETMIKSFDPKESCAQIGFCSSSIAEKQMNFDQYEKYVEDEIEKTICSSLGPFESLCKQIVRGNEKQIQTLKINYNIRDLMQIGQDKTTNLFSSTNLNQCARDQCQCCADRIDQKKQCAKTLGDQIASILSKSCDYCPTKDQCRQVLNDSQTQFDSFIDSLDSKQICVRLGFCNATSLCSKMGVFQEECEQTLAKFTQTSQQDSQLIQQHLPHTSVVILPTEKEQINDSNSTCILCEYFMNILTNYIHHQSTEQDIKQQLDKVCQQMPKTLQKPCEEFIDNYGASIVATLINQFDLSTLCQKLNLCTKQMNVNLAHLTRANIASCGICDYVSTYVHFALKRDSTDKSLQHALTTVCTHLTNQQQSQCQTLVQLFGPHIRQLPLNLGGNFCQQLTICETPKDEQISSTVETDSLHQSLIHVPLKKEESVKKDDEIKRKIMNNLDDTPECTLCHYVVSYLDAILKNNKSAEAIEAALAKVCNILPTKERSPCLEFVKTYGPILAELISEAADPDTICRYLGVCQVSLPEDTTTKMPPLLGSGNHDYIHLSIQNTPFTCTICQFIVSRMKHFIELNQTEEEILASLKESCNLFSVVSLKKQCTDFLEQYGPYIIQMISSDIEPKVACQSIGICQKNEPSPSSTSRPQSTAVPISSSAKYGKCIFGISYWCTSRQNAELCNAVELCERQVWSKKNKNIII